MTSRSIVPSPPPTTVMLLNGFDGGIVQTADVALQLAGIILPKIVEGLPPAVDDCGEQWLVRSSEPFHRDTHYLAIRKLDATVLAVDGEHSLHALPTPKTVEKFAAVLIESNYGDGELERQLPFTIVDKGGSWEALGRCDASRSTGGSGRFHLKVQKHDAQVLDMSFQWTLSTAPEVKKLARPTTRSA